MATTLANLLSPPTKELIRAELLQQMQGVGFTSLTGFSVGTVTLSGIPTAAYDVRVLIIAAGNLGAATFQYSTDGGTTWSGTTTVPTLGTFAIPGTTLSIVFTNGPVGTASAFNVGDVFRVQTRVPTLPATAWQTGSVPLTLIENDAAVMEDLYSLVGIIGASGLLETCSGPWLDLLAAQVYGLTRNAAVAVLGTVTLTDTGAAGPFTLTAGQLTFASPSGQKYQQLAAATLPLSGTVVVNVQAVLPGAAANVWSASTPTLVTSLPGVTLSLPVVTTSGADIETDTALKVRCRARWPALGFGTPNDAYKLWALTADSSITQALVMVDPTTPGNVLVYLAGAGLPATAPAVANANAYIQPRVPLAVTAVVAAAVAFPVSIVATINVKAAYLASATLGCAKNLSAFFNGGTTVLGEVLAGVPIGGSIYLSQLLELLQEVPGVRDVTLTSPVANIVLPFNNVAGFTQTLTFNSI